MIDSLYAFSVALPRDERSNNCHEIWCFTIVLYIYIYIYYLYIYISIYIYIYIHNYIVSEKRLETTQNQRKPVTTILGTTLETSWKLNKLRNVTFQDVLAHIRHSTHMVYVKVCNYDLLYRHIVGVEDILQQLGVIVYIRITSVNKNFSKKETKNI